VSGRTHNTIGFDDLAESKEFRQFFVIVKELTGILVELVSPDGTRIKRLFSKRAENPVCRLVYSRTEGRRACVNTDLRHVQLAASRKQAFHYLCHAGLIDMVMPIMINGEHVATIICGQVLPRPHSEQGCRQLARRLKPLGLPAAALRKAYYDSPHCSLDKFRIIMNLFSFFVEHFGEISWRLKQARQEEIIPIQRAQRFIHDHFQEPITLQDVARSAALSPNYFSTLFHKMAGTTVKHYLQVIRANAAKQLLTLTPKRITDIAFEVGFSNQTDFNRVFKKREGCSPRQYRQSNKGRFSADPSRRSTP
jgi:AraC-like DNA-binding protein/ligand-binding sensor protein